MKKNHIVITVINNAYYMTNLQAESMSAAEHAILDKGICGKHEYAIVSCMAFDAESMRTETFIACALTSTSISFNDLMGIIEKRNSEIRAKDAAENRIHEIEKQMKALAAELEAAKAILSK